MHTIYKIGVTVDMRRQREKKKGKGGAGLILRANAEGSKDTLCDGDETKLGRGHKHAYHGKISRVTVFWESYDSEWRDHARWRKEIYICMRMIFFFYMYKGEDEQRGREEESGGEREGERRGGMNW
jgi:hypothetical protein